MEPENPRHKQRKMHREKESARDVESARDGCDPLSSRQNPPQISRKSSNHRGLAFCCKTVSLHFTTLPQCGAKQERSSHWVVSSQLGKGKGQQNLCKKTHHSTSLSLARLVRLPFGHLLLCQGASCTMLLQVCKCGHPLVPQGRSSPPTHKKTTLRSPR